MMLTSCHFRSPPQTVLSLLVVAALVVLHAGCGCPGAKSYSVDEPLPTINTTSRAVGRKLAAPSRLDFSFNPHVLSAEDYTFPPVALSGREVVHVSMHDDGKPFHKPQWQGSPECHQERPTKKLDVQLNSEGGFFAEQASAKLYIEYDGLVARFTLDELQGDGQSTVKMLKLAAHMRAEWRFELRFKNDGALTHMNVVLAVVEERDGVTSFPGELSVGDGVPAT